MDVRNRAETGLSLRSRDCRAEKLKADIQQRSSIGEACGVLQIAACLIRSPRDITAKGTGATAIVTVRKVASGEKMPLSHAIITMPPPPPLMELLRAFTASAT